MKLNEAGISLIKSFESCKLAVYKDERGLNTVGYGHRTDLPVGSTITQGAADEWFLEDISRTVNALLKIITLPLDDNQFSACVSLAFNIGVTAFENSSMLKIINAGGIIPASKEFLKWDHVDGVVSPGLLRRRLAEQTLFNTPEGGA